MVQRSILTWIEAEENSLATIVHLVMHFCINVRSEDIARPVWMELVKVIHLWTDLEGELMAVIQDAFKLFPHIVTASMERWVHKFLCGSNSSIIRSETEKWLIEDVFPTDLVLGPLDEDGTRPYQARKLAEKCIPDIEAAYHDRRSKRAYDSSIRVMQQVLNYIETMRERVEASQGLGESKMSKKIPPALRCEYDESRTVLSKLHQLGAMIGDWDPAPTLSTGPGDVRRSVELHSDALTDDEEEDDEAWDSEGSV